MIKLILFKTVCDKNETRYGKIGSLLYEVVTMLHVSIACCLVEELCFIMSFLLKPEVLAQRKPTLRSVTENSGIHVLNLQTRRF